MKCKGCELCRSGKVPEFASDEEMIAFWRTHSPSDFPQANIVFKSGGRKVQPRVRISFMIAPDLKADLEKLAEAEGTGYQTLMHRYLSESVAGEIRKGTHQPLASHRPFDEEDNHYLTLTRWTSFFDNLETTTEATPAVTIKRFTKPRQTIDCIAKRAELGDRQWP